MKTPFTDFMHQAIRTGADSAAGVLAAFFLAQGYSIDQGPLVALLVVSIAVVYSLAVRFLAANVHPAFGYLKISKVDPTYQGK